MYNRVSLQGTMPGGEVWTVNPCYGGPNNQPVVSFDDLQAWATAIGALDSGNVLGDDIRSLLSNLLTLNVIRCELHDDDGTLLQAAEFTKAPAISGTDNPSKPYQVAVVASLLTGRPGRSYNGRLYWPAIGAQIGIATLRLTAAQTQAIADATATLLRAIATAAPVGAALVPVVVSHKLGTHQEVTSVRVGDVLDTQRRRRDSLVEAYRTALV